MNYQATCLFFKHFKVFAKSFNLLFSVIPIFGVLTYKDKIAPDGEDYKTLEQEFKEGLGLQNNRFLLCTSYCDDYDESKGKSRLKQRHPELAVPILEFMQQVSVHMIISIKHYC